MLVEDEPQMAEALTAALGRFDIVVDRAPDLSFAREAVAQDVNDVFILDRQLPDGEGLELILHLRKLGITVPVIVLTARGAVRDRVSGLDVGADDYLAKPFAVEELIARIRAVMRRPAKIGPTRARIGQLEFSLDDRAAYVADELLDLPRRELLVLEALVRRQGRTVLRQVLEEAVYSFDDEIQSNALDSHISRLRRKLAGANAGVEIHSIRGMGYLLRPA